MHYPHIPGLFLSTERGVQICTAHRISGSAQRQRWHSVAQIPVPFLILKIWVEYQYMRYCAHQNVRMTDLIYNLLPVNIFA